jgi:hypothetical protein
MIWLAGPERAEIANFLLSFFSILRFCDEFLPPGHGICRYVPHTYRTFKACPQLTLRIMIYNYRKSNGVSFIGIVGGRYPVECGFGDLAKACN